LRDYGILGEDEHCDADCPIEYHGPQKRDRPGLAVLEDRDAAGEAEAVAGERPDVGAEAEADGGVETETATAESPSPPRSFGDRVLDALAEFQNDDIQAKTARHYIAQAFVDHYHFLYPEEEVRGWRSTLHIYDEDEGVYEPRGESFIERKLEYVAGDFATNQVTNEIIGKVKRMSIERDSDRFRSNPERLVVGNGILDLHTGELDDYTPHEYHRAKIEWDWNPDAGDPEAIDSFLHDIVDDSDVSTLYRLIAHTLYKEYLGEKAAILIGSGENGKSMFLDTIEEFLGGYNVAHRELQDFSDDEYALNNLQGKFANLATEIGEQELRDTTAFKKATGRDVIDAPVKYESPITFENHATLMFATNEMPVFGQDNHAIWRRWLYLDFPYTFDADDPSAKDPEPERVIKHRMHTEAEFEALLYRCQQEIQRWFEGEPFFEDAMTADEVRDKMKKAAEPVYAFATTCLEAVNDDDEFVEKSIVRAAYQAFADEEDLPRMPNNEFGSRLLSLRDYPLEPGQKRVDGVRTRVYKRCRLTSRGRQLVGLDRPDDGQEQVDDSAVQAREIVEQQARDMFEANDQDPVPREGIEWGVSGDIGKTTAERAVAKLIEDGTLIEAGDGYVPK
jgi:putative DNA primase/helicase